LLLEGSAPRTTAVRVQRPLSFCVRERFQNSNARKGGKIMSSRIRRREVLGAGVAAGLASPQLSQAHAGLAPAPATPHCEKLGWQIACQLYTFRHLPFYEAIEQIAALGIRYLEPCFFLRLDAKRPKLTTSESLGPADRAELKRRIKEHGLAVANYYARIGADESAAKRTFEFAKELGAATIVSEPPPEAFDMVERLCDSYGINLAIHNHPRRPHSRYWHPKNVLKVCEGRSKRIGACVDTGHWVRSGLKPLDCLKMLGDRVITAHLKDVAEWGKVQARDVPLGTGKADIAGLLRYLHKRGFRGALSIEYEHQSPQLVADVRQSVRFIESVAAELTG